MAKEIDYLSSFSSHLDLLDSEGRHLEMANEILNRMMKNVDLSPLAGKIIRFLAVPYPPCKKVMHSFLTRYSSSIADLNILATNTLRKDFEDPNPFIRKLVMQTSCSVQCLWELGLQLLPRALSDSSGSVRCAAAVASAHLLNPREHQDLIDALYAAIRDPDPSVVCASLSSLDEILEADGGVVVNAKITHYLLKRISEFKGWDFAVIHTVLKKYAPKTSEELLFSLNALDGKLMDAEPEVFLLAADLALYYAVQLDKRNFSGDVIAQIAPRLKVLLHCSSPEVLAAVLESIKEYLPEHGSVFVSFYRSFFCQFSDSTFVKVKKLQIIISLMNESNIFDIVKELLMHCCDSQKEVSSQAIHSFTEVMRKHSQLSESIMSTFVSMMDIQFNNLSEEVLSALSAVDLTQSPEIKDCVLSAVAKYSQNVKNIDSKLSLLKFVGDYGKDIPNAPYIIEGFLTDEEHLGNERFMSFLLTTSVKLFLNRPEEMQFLLGRMLQEAQKSPCLLLQKQAAVYYHLLKDVNLALKVVLIESESQLAVGDT